MRLGFLFVVLLLTGGSVFSQVLNRDRYFSAQMDPIGATNRTSVRVRTKTGRDKPNAIAILVSPATTQTAPDLSQAKWVPCADELIVNLGEGDGKRHVSVAIRWNASDRGQVAFGWDITVRTQPATLVITNPPARVVSQPIIQLRGYSDKPLEALHYDVIRENGSVTDQNKEGFVNDQYFDKALFEFTSNFFTCYDIELSPGNNTIVLRWKDNAGNTATTNVTVILDLASDKTPPVIVPGWPRDGQRVSGDQFTARGRVDDDNAKVVGEIVGHNQTNRVVGLTERDGAYHVENLPLQSGANELILTATDAAGNVSHTNLTIYQSELVLTIDPLPAQDLTKSVVTVRGKISSQNHDVWVNGVKASVESDGQWVALKVPATREGSFIVLSTSALPKSGKANLPVKQAKPKELTSIQAALGTEAITLNTGVTLCGNFVLHLAGTEGKSFVLLDSTNLVTWTPVLTNLNSGPTFDFTDTNVNSFPCRFFRVVPLP